MHIHGLQHISYEGLGSTGQWARERGHRVTMTRLFDGEALPAAEGFDVLFVMGGPMNIYQEETYPWFKPEKAFIRQVIDAGKPVVGICLGAQLIADVLGAEVVGNGQQEIGWFPISPIGSPPPALDRLLEGNPAFHWHGDRFELPSGATLFAASAACPHQGFSYGEHVLAFQFHPEVTEAVATAFVSAEPSLPQGAFVQSASQMLAQPERFAEQQARWWTFLDEWLGPAVPTR